jgi:hypothetical protein
MIIRLLAIACLVCSAAAGHQIRWNFSSGLSEARWDDAELFTDNLHVYVGPFIAPDVDFPQGSYEMHAFVANCCGDARFTLTSITPGYSMFARDIFGQEFAILPGYSTSLRGVAGLVFFTYAVNSNGKVLAANPAESNDALSHARVSLYSGPSPVLPSAPVPEPAPAAMVFLAVLLFVARLGSRRWRRGCFKLDPSS